MNSDKTCTPHGGSGQKVKACDCVAVANEWRRRGCP